MKFLLSRELGRLAKWLRILGYDTAYFNSDNTSSLVLQALREDRVILTRNHCLAYSCHLRAVLVKAQTLKEQLQEILKELKLNLNSDIMFTRCIICNLTLVSVEKDAVKDKIPEYVFSTQDKFIVCPGCQRVYWQGTHWGNVAQTLKEIEGSV